MGVARDVSDAPRVTAADDRAAPFVCAGSGARLRLLYFGLALENDLGTGFQRILVHTLLAPVGALRSCTGRQTALCKTEQLEKSQIEGIFPTRETVRARMALAQSERVSAYHSVVSNERTAGPLADISLNPDQFDQHWNQGAIKPG